MEKGIYVKDIKPGQEISGFFVVSSANLANSRKGPYWKMILSDATGELEAKIWFPKSREYEQMPSGAAVLVQGKSSLFNDKLQLELDDLKILEESDAAVLGMKDILPGSDRDPEEMFAELRQICLEEFKHQPWRRFVFDVLNDQAITAKFRIYPAAKNIHHAYLGGLLEHTLGVTRLCLAISDLYPELDRQTLLAGAVFHDIGKIEEFSIGMAVDYTTPGSLLGHIFLGIELLTPFLAKSGLETDLVELFKHLILSHHGEYEYGSPKLPQTAEAFALHYADNLDARLAQCRAVFAREAAGWSSWQRSLERSIFLGQHTPERPKRQERKPEGPNECLSLLKG